jgi:hypothetical protein
MSSRDLPRTPVSREHLRASRTPETRIDPGRHALRKYHQILDNVRRSFDEAVNDIKQRMTSPSALMVTTSPYIHSVRESLLVFTDTIVHALNTFMATVTHSCVQPMGDQSNARVIVTGDLHSFVASRITEELSLTLSSTDYISNKVFLYPSVRTSISNSEPAMLSISISYDVRFNGNGHVILLINKDENQTPSVFIVRERRGWDGSPEQDQQLWSTVMSILDEV